MFRNIILGVILLVIAVWAFNSSFLTGPAEDAQTRILSHRGVHQTYSRENLGMQDCTAVRIFEPSHGFLENTIPSMRAAFEAGADIVEIDIHWTADGHFAVFHDWTLDCRTNGRGVTEDASRADLKKLDVGYGYTADGGETYPFRGRFVGAMPMLDEVFDAFPDGRFYVNLKSNNPEEGAAFAAFIGAHPEWRANVYGFYGGARAVAGAQSAFPDIEGVSTALTKACLTSYALWGWSGHVPENCRNTQILVPISHAHYLWGWPHKFTARMKAAGSDVMLAGPYSGNRAGAGGINTGETAARVPADFDGFIWTDRVEEIVPFLQNRE